VIKSNLLIIYFLLTLIYFIATQFVYAQTVDNEITSNTLENVEKSATTNLSRIDESDNNLSESTSNTENTEQKEMKPVSDEMLEYAEEQFPSLNDPTLSRQDKVKILNEQFTDPEEGLKSLKNANQAFESLQYNLQAFESLQYNLDQVQEKLYIECTVNKETGEFNSTINCMEWSRENAAIPVN